MKKSGLADSPFFSAPLSPGKVTVLHESSPLSTGAVEPVVQNDIVRTPEQVNGRTDEHPNTRTPEQAIARTGEPPKVESGNRAIKRQSYNIYVDQHEALQRLEATSTLSGKSIFISEMVRQALDEFFKKHT